MKLGAVALVVALVDCRDEQLVSTKSNKVTGNMTVSSNCTATERDWLTEQFDVMQYVISSPALRHCIGTELVSNQFMLCTNDPAEVQTTDYTLILDAVMKALQNANDVEIGCQGAVEGATAQAAGGKNYGYIGTEGFFWDRDDLDAYIAQNRKFDTIHVMAHELMHEQGFLHYPYCAGTPDIWGLFSALDPCVSRIARRSIQYCALDGPKCGSNGRWVVNSVYSTQCSCVTRACQDFQDQDMDGLGDRCDVCPGDPVQDFDGDGVCSTDNCPSVKNASQMDVDGDGTGDACDVCQTDPVPDTDGDGLCSTDLCPDIPSSANRDLDGDGIGDLCDDDIDGDGYRQSPSPGTDNCPYVSNVSQLDTDGDGLGDACDCWPNGVGPGQVTILPMPDCDVAPLQRFLTSAMEGRLRGIARYLVDADFATDIGDPSEFLTCKYGCFENDPKNEPSYLDAVEYFGEWERTEPRSYATVDDIRQVLLMQEDVSNQNVDLIFERRLGGDIY